MWFTLLFNIFNGHSVIVSGQENLEFGSYAVIVNYMMVKVTRSSLQIKKHLVIGIVVVNGCDNRIWGNSTCAKRFSFIVDGSSNWIIQILHLWEGGGNSLRIFKLIRINLLMITRPRFSINQLPEDYRFVGGCGGNVAGNGQSNTTNTGQVMQPLLEGAEIPIPAPGCRRYIG